VLFDESSRRIGLIAQTRSERSFDCIDGKALEHFSSAVVPEFVSDVLQLGRSMTMIEPIELRIFGGDFLIKKIIWKCYSKFLGSVHKV